MTLVNRRNGESDCAEDDGATHDRAKMDCSQEVWESDFNQQGEAFNSFLAEHDTLRRHELSAYEGDGYPWVTQNDGEGENGLGESEGYPWVNGEPGNYMTNLNNNIDSLVRNSAEFQVNNVDAQGGRAFDIGRVGVEHIVNFLVIFFLSFCFCLFIIVTSLITFGKAMPSLFTGPPDSEFWKEYLFKQDTLSEIMHSYKRSSV
eukprot:Nk52_evm2s349 gene=Nk52_evmTU2s349